MAHQGQAPALHGAAPSGGALVLQYRGQEVPVTSERFVIGRGQRSCHLVLKDPNVSRQHAIIEMVGGRHFLADMGSTNGIELQGNKLQRRQIAPGDVYDICGHELRFIYR